MQDRSQREQPHPREHMNGVSDQVDDFNTDNQGGGKDENEEDKVTLKDVAKSARYTSAMLLILVRSREKRLVNSATREKEDKV